MTEDDNNDVDIDLNDFENEFYGTSSPEKSVDAVREDQEETEEVAETEDNSLATEDDDENEDEDVEETEDDEDSDEEEEVEEVPAPKQKRNRAQERIEKLLERERVANERANALEKRLAELEARTEVKKEEAPALRDNLPADAPDPDAVDENGDPLYELGEFDKKYIRDITRYTIAQETKAAKEEAEKEAYAKQMEAAQAEIRDKWIENLDKAEAEEPDIRDNIRTLTETFQDVEPQYGEYLASTLMASDYGPQIMNYLSQNIGEAQKIVASGPAAATLAIGRLEARFIPSTEQEPKRNTKLVSKAPKPPENPSRGAKGKFSVPDDTDDLDAFERKFYT
jgi:DNA repair exonuclease SbcCD ATPase subunit